MLKYYLCDVAKTGKNIELAADLLRTGKLVAIPTETVYGLAANALDEIAVLKIFEVKNRPFFDPLIVHVHTVEAAKHYAFFEDERLLTLATKFWPGPLTLLLPKRENIPDIVTSALPRVAIRVPNHPMTLELLRKTGLPLAAPSANPFGYVSPTEPSHVEKQLGEKIEYILDGGPCNVGLESTIVGIENGGICIYRLGGLAIETIEAAIGAVDLKLNSASNPNAPGQLNSHYAPKKDLIIGEITELIDKNSEKKIAILCFGKKTYSGKNIVVFNLSEKANLDEAAINLFNYLRQADDSDAELVVCEKLPDTGLGRAINDRLKRAALQKSSQP